jgi:hypothetical protein
MGRTGMAKHSFFRERQKPGCHAAVGEGGNEPLLPLTGLLRRIAERKDRGMEAAGMEMASFQVTQAHRIRGASESDA